MERLWTPWRMQYIAGDKAAGGCVFCAALAHTDDREALVIYRGESALVMLNKYPYNNGHLLVVPHLHTADLSALAPATRAELMQLIARSIEWLKAASHPDGFNVGLNLGKSAGAGMADHLHFHIVPRWTGDTSFMTISGETRVLPEWLDETWNRLRRVIEPA
ncbi:MAG: HIT domain-containing protein [Chloroflexi bacterium]|nr:HIT domain-containing protein [Chloroflexota bacterium]